MDKRWIVFCLLAAISPVGRHTAVALAEQEWRIDEIIDVAQAQASQVNDIQYAYTMQVIPLADPNYILSYDVSVMRMPAKNWEKRTIIKTASTSAHQINQTVQAWDGEYYRYNTAVIREGGPPPTKEGIISAKKDAFSPLEPLELLGVKGSKKGDLVLFLSGPDVILQGLETLAGHQTVVVSVNKIPTLPREDSLVMKYWLDMEHGSLPRRTELYYKADLKRVTSDVTLSELKPGLFFPAHCQATTFDFEGKSEGLWSKGETISIQVDVNSIQINQGLQKQDFALQFDYGQPVWDEDIGMTYYEGLETSASADKLRELLDQIVQETLQPIESTNSQESKDIDAPAAEPNAQQSQAK
jgi:hypothetical protein